MKSIALQLPPRLFSRTFGGLVLLGMVSLAEGQGPIISSIGNVRIPEETTTFLNFTVAEPDGIVTNVSATIPANPALATITTTLNGTNVMLTISGNFNESGTNSVEVVAADDHGFSATN